jgi:serine phosphatase RsbU (regulator of sigma subunit)
MNEVQDEYGEERFYECVKRLGDLPADKIVEEIVADIQKFTGGIEQSDDITMVVMKVEK